MSSREDAHLDPANGPSDCGTHDNPSSEPETVSAVEGQEPGETGETGIVANGEFLRRVFGDEKAEPRPLVVSFEGSPNRVPPRSWVGTPWQAGTEGEANLPINANNYFSLATFKPDEAGHIRRQKSRFHALHAFMLDDVGTKVSKERLTLPPSWLLETSPGNHQAGYLLFQPLSDSIAADRLMNAIVEAGLCDPGAKGPTGRLARLPQAVNGKHTPPFQCRLVRWSPDLRYSIRPID